MNPSLQKAMNELKAVSPTASRLIDEHFSGFSSLSAVVPEDPVELRTLVSKLLDTVEYQSKELERLSEKLRIPDRDLTADTAKFKEQLKPFDIAYLVVVYDKNWFKTQVSKDATRKALASALVEYSNEKKRKPSDLWIAIVNNNGALED